MNARRAALVAVAGAAVVAVAAPAWAYFTITAGPANGTATAAVLAPPATVAGAALNSSSARVSWTAPATSPAPTSYVVRRTSPSASVVCTVAAPATSCDDVNLASSTAYAYTVEGVLGGSTWVSTTEPAAALTPAGNFLVTPSTTTPAAGQVFQVTLTARTTSTGLADASYDGVHPIAWSGPGNAPNGTAPTLPASATFTDGVSAPINVTLVSAQAVTLVATEGARSGSASLTVSSGTAGSFVFTSATVNTVAASCNGGTVNVGNNNKTFAAKVSARDTYGNPATVTTSLTVTLALGSTDDYSLSPASLTIPAGASETSAAFTVTHTNSATNSTTVSTTNAGFSPQATCTVAK